MAEGGIFISIAIPDEEIAAHCTWMRGKQLKRGTILKAKFAFEPTSVDELRIRKDDIVIVEKPCEEEYWYVGMQRKTKEVGRIPVNFFEILRIPNGSKKLEDILSGVELDENNQAREGEAKSMHFPPGSLVEVMQDFDGQEDEDLQIKKGESLFVINEDPDNPEWFLVRNGETNQTGLVPGNFINLIYAPRKLRRMAASREQLQPSAVESDPAEDEPDPVFEDFTAFQAHSGWFSESGHPLGLDALYHVLAKKANLPYIKFMDIERAVYILDNFKGVEAKKYVGSAENLHKELAGHFMAQQFDKPSRELTPLDQELTLHSPHVHDWALQVIPINEEQSLNVEQAKLIFEHGTLHPDGFNASFQFSSDAEWQTFRKWHFKF